MYKNGISPYTRKILKNSGDQEESQLKNLNRSSMQSKRMYTGHLAMLGANLLWGVMSPMSKAVLQSGLVGSAVSSPLCGWSAPRQRSGSCRCLPAANMSPRMTWPCSFSHRCRGHAEPGVLYHRRVADLADRRIGRHDNHADHYDDPCRALPQRAHHLEKGDGYLHGSRRRADPDSQRRCRPHRGECRRHDRQYPLPDGRTLFRDLLRRLQRPDGAIRP